jgi:hypothetical protein
VADFRERCVHRSVLRPRWVIHFGEWCFHVRIAGCIVPVHFRERCLYVRIPSHLILLDFRERRSHTGTATSRSIINVSKWCADLHMTTGNIFRSYVYIHKRRPHVRRSVRILLDKFKGLSNLTGCQQQDGSGEKLDWNSSSHNFDWHPFTNKQLEALDRHYVPAQLRFATTMTPSIIIFILERIVGASRLFIVFARRDSRGSVRHRFTGMLFPKERICSNQTSWPWV